MCLSQVVENGILYLISLEGQKTGFYADQRENRRYTSSISEGRKVVDICCYTGGFALNAAVGGALSVTGTFISLTSNDREKYAEEPILSDIQTIYYVNQIIP